MLLTTLHLTHYFGFARGDKVTADIFGIEHALALAEVRDMASEVQPVFGVFADRDSAESAARALRSEGLAVDVAPVADCNPGVLPVTQTENKIQMLRAVVTEPMGLMIGVSFGLLLGVAVTNLIVGILAAVVFAFAGAFAGLWLGDRPTSRYREYARTGGVLVTVRCESEQAGGVIGALKRAHAVEVEGGDEPWIAARP
ncbi:MAG: hypothetical protein R2762_25575 [Bryobacteraceae bacterium]